MDEAIALLRSAESIAAFSGAGLSAESGVPTFRDAQTGMWAKFDPMQLASPQGFARDPETVLNWYRSRREMLAGARPNPAHIALAQRADITQLTQNVDNLLEQAGAVDVVHLHGRLDVDRCHAECGFEEVVDLSTPPGPRTCPACGEPIRPGVVWFGEVLPIKAWGQAEAACARCDVLLVIGTSAEVYPAAGLIDLAKATGSRVIVINTERSGASGLADVELLGPAGQLLPRLLAP